MPNGKAQTGLASGVTGKGGKKDCLLYLDSGSLGSVLATFSDRLHLCNGKKKKDWQSSAYIEPVSKHSGRILDCSRQIPFAHLLSHMPTLGNFLSHLDVMVHFRIYQVLWFYFSSFLLTQTLSLKELCARWPAKLCS